MKNEAGPVPAPSPPPGIAAGYRLRLFVAGSSARSLRTVQELRQLCQQALGAAVDLEVVDIYQQPELAERDGVVAAPTLLRISPAPVRRLVGDLSDEQRVLRMITLAIGEDEDVG
ncbi:circadian clock KaiB family protein [Teichococcus wenyumeiae]|uniref:circadian clock KaiB family protein n=1 Tax=Teichococcus wenyumeiae TaxID=2478470 RepID=UPI0018F3B8A6|nr:circadian clock KaiB family protein [Pseudoroseomonas wenyumeiae]